MSRSRSAETWLRFRQRRPAAAMLLVAAMLLAAPVAALSDEDAAVPAPEGTPAPEEGADYRIGVEDVITVTVWKNADLTVTVPVRPDGKISLPLIDDVPAAGLTPLQLKEDLIRRWKAFLSAPEVSVIVKEINSYKIYLVGEIARPGEIRLKARTRLLQAISLAGGFTTFAERGKIVVLRGAGSGEVRFEVNYNKLVSGARPEDNLMLQPGDTVVVP